MTAAKYPHVAKAEQYVKDVLSGKILACTWVKLACQRHLDDKEKSRNLRTFEFIFDRPKAERACRFIECLPHIKGDLAGEEIDLQPWQCFILCMIFGWVFKSDGRRRFNQAYIWVPRKNGKSIFAAAIGIYMMVADGEEGAEVYCGATNEYQAYEVFTPAKLMIDRAPGMQKHFGIEINKKNINVVGTATKFEPIIGRPGDGSSPHCSIHDEYHEHVDRSQVDAMWTGMGNRSQPLQMFITTAGVILEGPCKMDFDDMKKVLKGLLDYPRAFCIIYTIDDDDDWTTVEAQQKANPNYGVSVRSDFLENALKQALQAPRLQAMYKTKHLNQFVGAANAYINVERWRNLARPDLKIEQFAGRRAYLALDLAARIDLASWNLLIPDEDRLVTFGKHYLPSDRVAPDVPSVDHLRSWANAGWIKLTDGAVIDYDFIINDLRDVLSKFDIIGFAYDPWQAHQLSQTFLNDGAPMVEYRHIIANLSAPMKELDAMIRDTKSDRIVHNGDPVLQWAMSNLVARFDAKDNVYPRKERPENKIDPVMALIMNIGQLLSQTVVEETEIFVGY